MHQVGRRAAGAGIVQTGISQPLRARTIGENRDHRDSFEAQHCDRITHRTCVARFEANPLAAPSGNPGQKSDQIAFRPCLREGKTGTDDSRMQVGQNGFRRLPNFSAETVGCFHHDVEKEPPSFGGKLALLDGQFLDRVLNPSSRLWADMGPVVQDPVDRGGAQAGLKGDLLDWETMRHLMDS